MQAASPAFLAAVQTSHRIATLVQVQDTTGRLLVDGAAQSLTVIDGSVSVDRSATIRRRCSVTLADPSGRWTPTASGDPLSPFTGNEIVLWRGVTFDSGAQELIPLGVFRISKVAIADDGAGFMLTVTGYDRSRTVQRAATTDVLNFAAGTLVSTAVQQIVQLRVPAATKYTYSPTSATLPAVLQYAPATDMWKEAVSLAESIGFETYFDGRGNNVLQPTPVPATIATTLVLAEGPTCTMTSATRTLDDAAAYNDVIVTGQSTGLTAPVIGEAQDTNPSSPTYISGGYGDVPLFVQSPLVPDAATAGVMAQSLLTASLGLSEELTVSMIPNPTVDVNDAVAVTRSRLALNGATYVVEAMTVPLGASAEMQLTMRRIR